MHGCTVNTVLPATRSRTIRTDVCVIGAGPAGLSFARECADASFDVLLLEGGGYEAPDTRPGTSHLESPYYTADAIEGGRRQQFGGTAAAWGHRARPGTGRLYARTLPGETVDFEPVPARAASGWPLDLAELRRFQEEAHLAWTGQPIDNSVERWSTAGTPPLPLGDRGVVTKVAQYGPADVFTLRHRDDIARADNITVLVGSTVTTLESGADGSRVERAVVTHADGSRDVVSAEVFVLAGGGVENARLLLQSDVTAPGAVGNRYDNVGRHIVDHPEYELGRILPRDRGVIADLGLYDIHLADGDQLASGLLTLEEDVKREQGLLNMAAVFTPRPAGYGSGAERAARSLGALFQGTLVPHPLDHVRGLLSSPADTAALIRTRLANRRAAPLEHSRAFDWYSGGWSQPTVDPDRFDVIGVHVATEQTPSRDNRLRLAPGTDRQGRRNVHLELSWSAEDQENTLRSTALLAAAIEGAGIGRFERWVDFSGPTRPVNGGLHHPMGGTRMSSDPREGVVDQDCRVHGLANVYVAGSSVFPNGLGYANPTLTVVALSTRLAGHVAKVLTDG